MYLMVDTVKINNSIKLLRQQINLQPEVANSQIPQFLTGVNKARIKLTVARACPFS